MRIENSNINTADILAREIKFIEQKLGDVESLDTLIDLIDDPVKRSILSGLLKIKRDIGDRDLGEYLETSKARTRKRLFGVTSKNK